jgi:hypothetical protein
LCVKRLEKTNSFSIKFDDKINAAVKIGFVKSDIGDRIKEFYRLRNAIHLETAIKKSINYELDQSRLAYETLDPFLKQIQIYLRSLPTTDAPLESTMEDSIGSTT